MVTPPQNEHFVIIHLPACRSNSIKASFVFGTQTTSKYHCRGSEKYEKHRQGSQSAISGSIWILWSDENIFYATKIKIMTFFQQFVSSLSLLVSIAPVMDYQSNARSVCSSGSVSVQGCIFYVYLRFDLNENSLFLHWGGCRRAYSACVWWVISKWRYADEEINCWKKVFCTIIQIQLFVFSLHTKNCSVASWNSE